MMKVDFVHVFFHDIRFFFWLEIIVYEHRVRQKTNVITMSEHHFFFFLRGMYDHDPPSNETALLKDRKLSKNENK